jgi:hypothetical protein
MTAAEADALPGNPFYDLRDGFLVGYANICFSTKLVADQTLSGLMFFIPYTVWYVDIHFF